MITGAQIRAARGLLNLSVAELSEQTGLAINTIRRAEQTNDKPPITEANARLLLAVFENSGIAMIGADEQGVGVRFVDPTPPRISPRRRKG